MFVAGVANLDARAFKGIGVIFGFVAKWIVSGCVNVRRRKRNVPVAVEIGRQASIASGH